mmetsp:Transcript_2739/g.2898  ORF Transcript_2739/g.2898 Transcript_2739/m.2898 type:complete len:86 (-) Transcript_2739:218-475(-)
MAQEPAGAVAIRPQVLYSEMSENDQSATIEIAMNALRNLEKGEQVTYHRDAAKIVKTELDSSRGGTWNVVVGRSFGSFVTHETKT